MVLQSLGKDEEKGLTNPQKGSKEVQVVGRCQGVAHTTRGQLPLM